LFIFVLITLPLFLYLRGENGKRHVANLWAWLKKQGRLLFLFPLPLAVVYALLSPIFPLTYNIFNDWAHFAWLLYAFVAGYLLVADPQIMPIVDRVWRLALALGAVTSLGIIVHDMTTVPSGGAGGSTNSLFSVVSYAWVAFSTWFWLVALLGIGRRFLNWSARFLRYASEIAYPYYILHQTVIIVFGYYVVQWKLNLWLKFGIVLVVSCVLTALLCEVVKLTRLTRFIFGMKPAKHQQSTPASLKQSGAQLRSKTNNPVC
jgi:peptidoglycan/LPS O-acetylase OafA/YrhL